MPPGARAAALAGIGVLEYSTGISGRLAGMILGDFGADVTVLAGAGLARPNERLVAGSAAWDRNKRVRALPARGLGAEEVGHADVVIVGSGGADASTLSARHPGLVVLDLRPFAAGTPWSGGAESHELLAAVSGLAMRQSSHADVPVDLVYPHELYIQGLWGAACAVAALLDRDRTGSGQVVTVSGLDAALLTGAATFVIDPSDADGDTSATGPGGPNPCYTRYRCQDGAWLFLGALLPKFQRSALEALGLDVLDDPRINGQVDQLVAAGNRGWVRDTIAVRIGEHSSEHWLEALERAGCPASGLGRRDEWLHHPQIVAIGQRVSVDDPKRGQVVMPGSPLTLSATPPTIRSPAPVDPSLASGPPSLPLPGGCDGPAVADEPAPSPNGGAGPLAGVRVLDLGTVLAGPLAGSLLASLGADVIKVEPPTGDAFRRTGFLYNRGMRSLALDLKHPAGRSVFDRLVALSDVVIDNYRPGVLQKLSIDYANLTRVNERIITYSVTGFGDEGPMALKTAFDPILQAMSGMMEAQGGDDEPVFLTCAVNDIAAAVNGALASCIGLFERTRSGLGQRTACSLASMSVVMQSGELVEFQGRPPARVGGRDHPGPDQLDRFYRTSDGWIRLQASPEDAGIVAQALGLGALSPAAPDPGETRADSGGLADVLATLTADDAVARLASRSIPAVTASRAGRLQETAGDAFEEYPNSRRPIFVPRSWASFSRSGQRSGLCAPGLGEHSLAILEEAGYGAAELDRLVEQGVVVEGDPLILDGYSRYR